MSSYINFKKVNIPRKNNIMFLRPELGSGELSPNVKLFMANIRILFFIS